MHTLLSRPATSDASESDTEVIHPEVNGICSSILVRLRRARF
jgi:hypothetical protein